MPALWLVHRSFSEDGSLGEGWVSDFDIRISDFNHSGCFMQNKANLLAPQMNVNSVITKDYENERLRRGAENKAKTNPIKANFPDTQMNLTSFLTKDYENERLCRGAENKPKTNPIKPNLVRHSLGEGGFKRGAKYNDYFIFLLSSSVLALLRVSVLSSSCKMGSVGGI